MVFVVVYYSIGVVVVLLSPGTQGSSTESMSHMRQARGGVSSSSLEGYTDTVIDQQYVLIEASPQTDVSTQTRAHTHTYTHTHTHTECTH